MNNPLNADKADLVRIRQICSRFPEAEEGALQDRPLFHVRRRRFAIVNSENAPYRQRWESFGRSLPFATEPRRQIELENDARFSASPHHSFRGWMALDLRAEEIDWSEINELLESAYRHVAGKELVAELNRDGP
jgi:hypothetical protein